MTNSANVCFTIFCERRAEVRVVEQVKGIGRQGVVSKRTNNLQTKPMPSRPMPLLVQL